MLKSRPLSKHLKLTIYRSLLRPTVTFGSEIWTLTRNADGLQLRIWRVKCFESSLSLGKLKMGPGRIRTNYELDQLIHGADIVLFIKSRRLEWLGHVRRTDDSRATKIFAGWKPKNSRKK